MSAKSTGGWSPAATSTVPSSPPLTSSSIPSRATSAKADNLIVRTNFYAKDPEQTALIEDYERLAAPIANRLAGSITETLSRTPNKAGESPLGDIVADAHLAATRHGAAGGAAMAFTNPG